MTSDIQKYLHKNSSCYFHIISNEELYNLEILSPLNVFSPNLIINVESN